MKSSLQSLYALKINIIPELASYFIGLNSDPLLIFLIQTKLFPPFLSSTFIIVPLLSSTIIIVPLLSSTFIIVPLLSSTIIIGPLLSSTFIIWGGYREGWGDIRYPLTDSGRGVAPLNLEFFVPIFRIASQ